MSDLPIRRGTQENDRLAKLAKPLEKTLSELAQARCSARCEKLRETMRLFDKFLSGCPDHNIATELNGTMMIYRSELQMLEAVVKAQNAEIADRSERFGSSTG